MESNESLRSHDASTNNESAPLLPDSVPEPHAVSNITSPFPSWDPTTITPQIMPTIPVVSKQPDSGSDSLHLNGIEVSFPVASESGVDVIQQISATISQTDEVSSGTEVSDLPTCTSSADTSTKFEVVRQLRSLNSNIAQVIQAKPSSHTSSATNSEQSVTSNAPQPLVATSRDSNTSNDATLVSVQDLNIESEDVLSQMQKLFEQAATTYVPGGTYTPTQHAVSAVVSEPSVVTTSSAVINVELSQSSHPSFQSNIEAIVEMLLGTARSLSGLINPGEVPKSPLLNTILGERFKSSALEPVVYTKVTAENILSESKPACEAVDSEKQTTDDHTRPLTTNHGSSCEQPPDCLPGPSGLQQDTSTSATTSPSDAKNETQGLHANKEIQSLLDALLTSAESQGNTDKKDSKRKDSLGVKIHKCPECDKYFPRLSSLKRHVLLHMDARPFQCDQCEANYKSASQLNRHKRLHTGEKPAKCEFCNKDFRTYNELYVHRRTHTGEKPFECQYCGKCFSTRSYRNTHQRIHTGEKRFECDYCGMKFTESSARRVHRFTHTGETPYKCSECGRGFTQAGNLNKHVKTIHSKGKPFECQDCDKSFSIKQELHRHFQRVHSSDKPHKCSICEKSFAIFSDLTHHMRSHVFRCTKCGDKFKDGKELERHIIEVCVVPSDDDVNDEVEDHGEENRLETEEAEEVPIEAVSKRRKTGATSSGGRGKSKAKRPRRNKTEHSITSSKKRKVVDSQDDVREQIALD